jgi:hypothetical protein
MKNWRPLLYFFSMLVLVSLSCNLPVKQTNWGVSTLSVTPPSGPGSFSASLSGEADNGTSTLRCYVSAEGGNVDEFTKTLQHTGVMYDLFYFAESFTFHYTVPGTHALVCIIDNNVKTAWSADFMVVPAADFSPTPTFTPSPTSTPTELTIQVLNGTFTLPEAGGTCNDGTQYRDPSSAVAGTMVLTVNHTTKQASATLQGTGQGIVTFCDFPTMMVTRTINGATLHGMLDPSTNTLTMSGDVSYDYWTTCWIHDVSSGACTAGGQTQTYNMTLNGSISPAQSTGAGQIQWTGNNDWGTWQAP